MPKYTALRGDLDSYLAYYKRDRVHTGRRNAGKTPAELVYGARKTRPRWAVTVGSSRKLFTLALADLAQLPKGRIRSSDWRNADGLAYSGSAVRSAVGGGRAHKEGGGRWYSFSPNWTWGNLPDD